MLAEALYAILDTDVKITSDTCYKYIFTEGKINPDGSASKLRLKIDNARCVATSPSSFL
jgi:hypothetical protein